MIRFLILMMLTLLIPAASLFSSGFTIYEQGAKATAMAGAYIAQANDATAVFYNPAGITALKGIQINFGTTLIATDFAFTGPSSNNMDSKKYTAAEKGLFPPSHLYLTYQIHDRISAGFGFFSLFGLASKWGSESEPWVGRTLATNTELTTYFFNPQLAFKILDDLSVGAGLEIVNGSVKMERSVYFSPRNVFGESTLEANTQGYGYNLGVKLSLLERINLGLTYRSHVSLNFDDGDAKFEFPTFSNDVINQEIRAYFPFKTKGSSKLELPDLLGLGLSYQFTENLTAEVDYLRTGWSSYDSLEVTFKQPVAGSSRIVSKRNYENSYSLRFGLEYRLIPQLFLRAGYIWDRHAVPDAYVEPSLPEGDRHNYTIGLGYKSSGFSIDGAYHLLLQDDREINNSVHDFNGIYSGLANLYSLSIGYSL